MLVHGVPQRRFVEAQRLDRAEVLVTVRPVASQALLTSAQAAALLYVEPRTITRWAIAGKIRSIRMPGGHLRYRRSDIEALRQHDDTVSAQRPLQHSVPSGSPRLSGAHASVTGSAADLATAAVVLAEAVGRARDVEVSVTADRSATVARAVDQAADRAAYAAQVARKNRALAARLAAEAVASRAAAAAAAVRSQTDGAALRTSAAASAAAAAVVDDVAPGTERSDAATARRLAVVVEAAALAAADDATAAAVSVAAAVADAATEVAFVVAAADRAVESEVARTAAALQMLASLTARQAAVEAEERAVAVALIARDAAAAA